MKVVMDRGLCHASLAYCQRCSAAFIRHPQGHDRLCVLDVVDDGKETLTLDIRTDDRQLQIELTEEQRDVAGIEGWEALVDFDPALFRSGAKERWRELGRLPAAHDQE